MRDEPLLVARHPPEEGRELRLIFGRPDVPDRARRRLVQRARLKLVGRLLVHRHLRGGYVHAFCPAVAVAVAVASLAAALAAATTASTAAAALVGLATLTALALLDLCISNVLHRSIGRSLGSRGLHVHHQVNCIGHVHVQAGRAVRLLGATSESAVCHVHLRPQVRRQRVDR